jgi:hypothetical protein
MALIVGARSPRTLTLEDARLRDLPEDQKAILEQTIGKTFTLEDVSERLQDPSISKEARAILVAFKRTLVGDQRALEGKAYGKEGAAPLGTVKAHTLMAARALTGETDLQRRVETDLLPALQGHDDQLKSFVEYARRIESIQRPALPFMAIVGNPGHGKEEALAKFAQIVLGENAVVVDVDLRQWATNPAGLFGKDGPLSPGRFKKLEVGYQPPEPKEGAEPEEVHPGIVRILGVENLLANNKDAAEGIAKLLSVRRIDPAYLNVPVVFDFEQPPKQDVRQLLIASIGVAGTRNLASTAVFKNLDGDTLQQYAQVQLDQALALPPFDGIVLEMDRDAEELLKQVLATPYAPLDELDQRLYEALLSKFDTDPTIDTKTSVLRVSVDPRLATRPQEIAAIIKDLHEPFADLQRAGELFVVNWVAKQVDTDDQRDVVLERMPQLAEVLELRATQLLLGMPTDEPLGMAMVSTLATRLTDLASGVQRAYGIARRQHELQCEYLLNDEQAAVLVAAMDAVEKTSTAMASLPENAGHGLSSGWTTTIHESVMNWLTAARLMSDVLVA